MNIIEINIKKSQSLELSKDEILFFVNEFTAGNIPDYQASA
jgi:pyrimidine-nucleoside phosphorylase